MYIKVFPKSCNAHIATLLPSAYVVRGKVIFILGHVCLLTIGGGGGGYPVPGLGWRGTPSQVWIGGKPSQVWTGGGTPSQVWMVGGTPARSGWWGYPGQVWMVGGYPSQVWMMGGTLGTPHHDWMGYPPTMTEWGTSPPP